ncbi:hypothetical protein GBAR_LOCUS14931 [Geodia barretti]|uniref:Uncharacterized protein n=1 Tax=Geodia barretti TaxID=519541 RepID=A0AA35S9D3_GEOBA|nr:hypothetical protein GBAR_LOCUS14931 [Geodia barretti]
MTPFCWVGGGGDQENSTSLSPATALNISGDPEGAVIKTNSSIGLMSAGGPDPWLLLAVREQE